MSNIDDEFDRLIQLIKSIFSAKYSDYGPTWLLFRPISFADQLWIKAKRIRTLEENDNVGLINEGREPEYYGIVNYCVIFLITILFKDAVDDMRISYEKKETLNFEVITSLYDKVIIRVKELLLKKNHDYNEAWREMDIRSITDQILIKINRIKNIIGNDHKLLISENIDAQLCDIINYAIFSLLKIQ